MREAPSAPWFGGGDVSISKKVRSCSAEMEEDEEMMRSDKPWRYVSGIQVKSDDRRSGNLKSGQLHQQIYRAPKWDSYYNYEKTP